jgi:hypothetical protein
MSFKHKSNNDGRFSDAIWADLPEGIKHDPTVGVYACDTFTNFGGLLASTAGRYTGSRGGHYLSYQDTSDVISQLATSIGRLSIAVAATDNNESWLQSCGGTGVLGKFSSTAPKQMWFEARVATSQILTQNFFVGLAEEALAAANTITDAGAMASKDFVGFRALEDAPSKIDIVYRKAGQAETEVLAEAHTLVADAFVNLGWRYAREINGPKLRFYVNGAQAATVAAAALAAATFPDGEELAFLIGGKNANAANTYLCEGWQFGQMF